VDLLLSVGALFGFVGVTSILVGYSARVALRLARTNPEMPWRDAVNSGLGASWFLSRGVRPGALLLLVGVVLVALVAMSDAFL
jgi:hypothetical protein